jgi:hypothetical protein
MVEHGLIERLVGYLVSKPFGEVARFMAELSEILQRSQETQPATEEPSK